ncbi:hypothetical protein BDQ17DRAFT_1176452, partial [Cyathus striatus]
LESFGYRGLQAKLNRDGVHCLDNVMTLSCDMGIYFDSLRLWFEETDTPNKYIIGLGATNKPYLVSLLPETVTFQDHSSRWYSLPNPHYLKMHAAICRVAELSGVTE